MVTGLLGDGLLYHFGLGLVIDDIYEYASFLLTLDFTLFVIFLHLMKALIRVPEYKSYSIVIGIGKIEVAADLIIYSNISTI